MFSKILISTEALMGTIRQDIQLFIKAKSSHSVNGFDYSACSARAEYAHLMLHELDSIKNVIYNSIESYLKLCKERGIDPLEENLDNLIIDATPHEAGIDKEPFLPVFDDMDMDGVICTKCGSMNVEPEDEMIDDNTIADFIYFRCLDCGNNFRA